MTSKNFCVYLTTYTGNKLPMFYIGHSSIDKVMYKSYNGSVSSKKYREIWKSERKTNPHLFKTSIISTYSTKIEAEECENRLQLKLNVVSSPMYINQSVAIVGSYVAKNLTSHYLSGKRQYLDTISNKVVFLAKNEVLSHYVKISKKDRIVARRKTTGTISVVSRNVFDLDDDLVGVCLGMVPVRFKNTGKIKRIRQENFNENIHEYPNTGKVAVYDTLTNSNTQISVEEYKNLNSRYLSTSCGKIVAFSSIDKSFVKLSKEEYEKNRHVYKIGTHAYIRFINIETSEILKFRLDDLENIENFSSNPNYREYSPMEVRRGASMSDKTKAKKSVSMQGKTWYHDPISFKSVMCNIGDIPDGYVKGRPASLKPRSPRKNVGTVQRIHNAETFEVITIPKSDKIPDGWLKGNGRVCSDEEKQAKRIFSKNRMWIYNPDTLEETMISRDMIIPEGWVAGSLKIKNRRDPATGRFNS